LPRFSKLRRNTDEIVTSKYDRVERVKNAMQEEAQITITLNFKKEKAGWRHFEAKDGAE